ncbi:hypothetical protein [Nocardioides sp. W7]|uniref:hypothetical protein n=1 Tax=Nocardioides sp. W7 TaxID=2931390 RepID=UPI001FD1B644|nr:hypothetical protein [Nocardioides sp. W7]
MLPAPQIAFLSLSRARTPSMHSAINQWHQLDHRPENLALQGLAWGERFVLTPTSAAQAVRREEFSDFHYATFYWFDEPHVDSIGTWAELAEQSFREGRRPDVSLVDRAYMDFFRLVGTATSPDIRLSERALVHRPGTGMLMLATSVPTAQAREELHRRFAWELEELLPALAGIPGVAGAWCLQNDTSLAPSSWAAREAAQGTGGDRIVRLVMVRTEIEPPTVVLDRLRSDEYAAALQPPVTLPGRIDFHGSLETILPWQWDWFDTI